MRNRVLGRRYYSTNVNIEHQSKFLRNFIEKTVNQLENEGNVENVESEENRENKETDSPLPDHKAQQLLKKSEEV